MTAAISCERLTKRFGAVAAVDALTLEVSAGAAFGFLGPNGAGKTTTIRALLGLIRATSGGARVFGLDSWRSAVEIHRLTGTLPGDFRFDPELTGRGLVHSIARLRGLGRGEIDYADELARELHADLDRPLGQLSRGNHQKIGLVQAMFHRPRLLLLDEPTSGLDPLMQERFVAMVQRARADGATIFLSSHNLTEVQHICEEVAMIRNGRLIATDRVENLAARAVRHVQITFADAARAEALGQLRGARNLRVQGARASLEFTGNVDPLLSLLAMQPVTDLTIERASLEELFRSFYEGSSDA